MLVTLAMPPWAQAVLDSARARLVMMTTRPCAAALQGEAQAGDAAADDDEIVALSSDGRQRQRLSMSRVFPKNTAQAMSVCGRRAAHGRRVSASTIST